MNYVVKFYDGDYLQLRGGSDWGRTEYRSGATVWASRKDAHLWARRTGGTVYRTW